jgi:hypothetical protein
MSKMHWAVYPTLSWIALDVLPVQASSVSCERLFSGGGEIADDCRSRLGAERFEQLQMLKFDWQDTISDHALENSERVDVVDMDEFEEMLKADIACVEWDPDELTYLVE